ncbi:DNA-processing protein DprA [Limosilactobacillus equigenerosi]|uniref:DNA processing protein n=1 Tax=Limosilactobacillus equigenerosi DSM 18793 = JCM 14505 TaxID=1423742 RepID=A0A0R1UHZ3_9LACO|nr:DNA-processing protein DprA [Limosilactobacillus equigenerosi]KRL93007.1 DNA processing protein [Limosilactobacillus equigenerosi DSM 18793 = JCM 14505]
MQFEDDLFALSFCRQLSPHVLRMVARVGMEQRNPDLWTCLQAVGLTESQMTALTTELKTPWVQQQVALNYEVNHLVLTQETYPSQLREIYAAPVVLYYRGDLSLLTTPQLAVVGSRQMSQYAKMAMEHLLPPVIEQGITIVSGLAKGVDAWSHQLAMQHGGHTIAVIGSGLDVTYPHQHRLLQEQLAQQQLLITEYPLQTPPKAQHFPARNRIIAGLCSTCLVVEGKQKSGSLITANQALQENRNVIAVPGDIDRKTSVGTNELIAAGAKPVLTSDDILEEFSMRSR